MRVYVCAILSLCLLVGAAAAARWRQGADAEAERLAAAAVSARQDIERELRIRAATGEADLNPKGWPTTIDPAWFGQRLPRSPLVPRDHPWIEIAGPADRDALDPAIRQAVTRDVASFWYNPANGIVRARVGPAVTDEQAIRLYNRINGVAVASLFTGSHEAPPPPGARPHPSRSGRSSMRHLAQGGDQ
jgi:hypothetical protein